MLEGYVGWHGEGKTLCAVYSAVQWFNGLCVQAEKEGRAKPELWSNVDVVGARRFTSFAELLLMLEEVARERRRVLVLVDEAGVWLPSRFWNKMAEGILSFLQQRRRVGAGIDIIWTAPSLEHVDKMLRDLTQVCHTCKRYGGTEYSHDGGRAPWGFRVEAFDPVEVHKVKRKRRDVKLVPFLKELGALYETAVVDFNRDSDAVATVDARPDTYSDADRHAETRPVVTVGVTIPEEKRKGRK